MEAKKISFGFSKLTKKLNLLPSKESAKTESKVELIKCLEGQEIKLVQEKPEEQPLIIPLKESHKTSAALASLIKRRAVLLGEEEPEDNTATNETKEATTASNNDLLEDIEKRAARELLAEIQNNGSTNPANNLVLPVVKPEDLPLEGAKESNLDDYDSIPIQDYGKAMLRGMGWTEPPPKTNKKAGPPIDDTPIVRPKGMGLGADKALYKKPLLVAPESNEVLEVKRNAYVRILGGKHKYLYGQIEGFDDHAGRVIVKMAIGGAKEAFNEFLCQPVSRKEYAQYGKCINSTKYEEYKKKENEHGQIILNKDEKGTIYKNSREQKKLKKERKYSEEEDYKYQKSNENYEKNVKNEDYRDDKNFIKKESYNYRDERYNNGHDNYEGKDRNRNDDKDRQGGTNRNDERDHRRENNNTDRKDHRREYNRDDQRDQKREYYRDDDRIHRREYNKDNDRQRDHNRYETTSYRKHHDDDKRNYKDSRNDYPHSQKALEHCTSHRGNIDGDISCNRERQSDRNRDHDKVIDLNDSSDSESDSHASKYKKTKKSKHAKKKSKKSKSKYKSDLSSDTDTDSTSDSEEEKLKKHRKKTKKSKKQRERSRSRGRR